MTSLLIVHPHYRYLLLCSFYYAAFYTGLSALRKTLGEHVVGDVVFDLTEMWLVVCAYDFLVG